MRNAGDRAPTGGTLESPLRRALQTARHRVAVVSGDHQLTYDDLDRRIRGLQAGLRSLGLGPGSVVAGLARNSHRHLELWLGLPPAGLVVNDLNIRLAPTELQFILDDSGASVLVADDDHWSLALDLRERCPALRTLVHAGDGPAPVGAVGWDDLCGHPPDGQDPPVEPDTLAAISYTGGTTGRPKGVMQTHRNLVANAKHVMLQNPLRPEDRFLHSTPMFHAAGVANIYGLTWVGGTHVVAPGFDPELVGRLIEAQSVTVVVLVPTMVNMLINHPGLTDRDLSSWRLLIYAASPMPVPLLRRAMDVLPCGFVQVYGMTEACPHVAGSTTEDHRRGAAGDPVGERRLASCGTPVVGVDVEVRRSDGSVCAVDEVGEIVVRGPNVMPGYWNRPEETAAAFTDDGWYRSGDLASMDADGYLYIVDRAKDMIVSGGENVYTTEVETALHRHPAVLEAAVFGIPHDQWGEAVHAEVALRPGATVDADELIEACREWVGGFKVPRSIRLHTEPLPKSGAGKILKRELRAPYWQGQDKAVN